MKQPIVDFHLDELGDWVADLACQHTQHVRHLPPWQNRPWVVDPQQRQRFIGYELDCKVCDEAGADMMQCDLGTHHLAYDISGSEAGPPVLLSHCFAGNRHVWDAQLPALSAYRTIRYDTRGHGESGLPPGPYRLDDLGDDVVGLLDALGLERVHYVGISMGGMIGQNVALRFPHRVASLGLITTTCMSTEAERQNRQDRMAAVRREGIEAQHDYNMARWFSDQALRDQLPGVCIMSAAYRAFTVQAFEWVSHAILHDLDYAADLKRITAPTLVVASPDDPGVPRDISELMRDEIAGAEFHWLSPAKHLATLEHPERFNRILVDFLAKHAGRIFQRC